MGRGNHYVQKSILDKFTNDALLARYSKKFKKFNEKSPSHQATEHGWLDKAEPEIIRSLEVEMDKVLLRIWNHKFPYKIILTHEEKRVINQYSFLQLWRTPKSQLKVEATFEKLIENGEISRDYFETLNKYTKEELGTPILEVIHYSIMNPTGSMNQSLGFSSHWLKVQKNIQKTPFLQAIQNMEKAISAMSSNIAYDLWMDKMEIVIFDLKDQDGLFIINDCGITTLDPYNLYIFPIHPKIAILFFNLKYHKEKGSPFVKHIQSENKLIDGEQHYFSPDPLDRALEYFNLYTFHDGLKFVYSNNKSYLEEIVGKYKVKE